jgi:hypothetical protein
MGKVDRFEWYGLGKRYIYHKPQAQQLAEWSAKQLVFLCKPNPKTSQMALTYSIVNKMLSLS